MWRIDLAEENSWEFSSEEVRDEVSREEEWMAFRDNSGVDSTSPVTY